MQLAIPNFVTGSFDETLSPADAYNMAGDSSFPIIDDILNIFKVIRYLASFDKVFTITAIDIEKVGEKVGLDYTHKIFNSKYTIPITTKSEIHDFLKVEISKKLSSFIEEDFEKLYQLIKGTDIIVISDEVYDLITFDTAEFYSIFHQQSSPKNT